MMHMVQVMEYGCLPEPSRINIRICYLLHLQMLPYAMKNLFLLLVYSQTLSLIFHEYQAKWQRQNIVH